MKKGLGAPLIASVSVVVLAISAIAISHEEATFVRREMPWTLPNGLTKPGLAMELAATPEEGRAILDTGAYDDNERAANRRAVRWMQYWDFPFILAYVALFLVIARRAQAAGIRSA